MGPATANSIIEHIPQIKSMPKLALQDSAAYPSPTSGDASARLLLHVEPASRRETATVA
jgi:hypothetical protein